MLAVTRRDGPRRRPAPGKGSHRPHPSAPPRVRHRLAELPTSPLVARLSGREQRRVRKVGALRMKAMSYRRSEEHTSELQSLMRISYAVFCLQKTTSTVQKNNILE